MVDVSRNVVAVLLVLVIAVTSFTTIQILQQEKPSVAVSQEGNVELTIDRPDRAPTYGAVELKITPGGSS